MEKFDELFIKLESLNIIQTRMDWGENIPNELWYKYFKDNFKEIAYNLYVSTHRWYETSIMVIEIYDKLLGISLVSNVFSESMDVEDCYHHLAFMKMAPIQSITYKKLNK